MSACYVTRTAPNLLRLSLLSEGCLEACPEGRLIARHVDNQWQVDERIFLRFECGPRVYCLFETAGKVVERHGPFDGLTCVDGVIWAGADAIAALKNDEWSSLFTRRAWPKLRLAFAAEAPLTPP